MFFHPTLKFHELSLKEKLAILLEHAEYFEEEFGIPGDEERGGGGGNSENKETSTDGTTEEEEEEGEGEDEGEGDSKPIRRLSSCTRHLVKYVNAYSERHIPPLISKCKTFADLKKALEPFM